MTPPVFLDLASVAVFALTGALVASRAQLDIVGFVFIACLTAVGGGTVRDLLLGRAPVFWISSPAPIMVATSAAVLVFFTAHLLESRYKVIVWLDAIALSVAVSAGIAAAIETDQPVLIQILMGVTTGCLGGLMRDVVCNEVPLVLKAGELYVTAAFVGALATVVVSLVSVAEWIPLLTCVTMTFALRAGSIAFGWTLKPYKPRPPRQ